MFAMSTFETTTCPQTPSPIRNWDIIQSPHRPAVLVGIAMTTYDAEAAGFLASLLGMSYTPYTSLGARYERVSLNLLALMNNSEY